MNIKGHCYLKPIILQAVYFKLRFTLSYRDAEEIMKRKGVQVDHATIQRWVYKISLFLEAQMNKRKKEVGTSWRMDETYVKVKGQWRYLYRAVYKSGNTVDFLLTRPRQRMRKEEAAELRDLIITQNFVERPTPPSHEEIVILKRAIFPINPKF